MIKSDKRKGKANSRKTFCWKYYLMLLVFLQMIFKCHSYFEYLLHSFKTKHLIIIVFIDLFSTLWIIFHIFHIFYILFHSCFDLSAINSSLFFVIKIYICLYSLIFSKWRNWVRNVSSSHSAKTYIILLCYQSSILNKICFRPS